MYPDEKTPALPAIIEAICCTSNAWQFCLELPVLFVSAREFFVESTSGPYLARESGVAWAFF